MPVKDRAAECNIGIFTVSLLFYSDMNMLSYDTLCKKCAVVQKRKGHLTH